MNTNVMNEQQLQEIASKSGMTVERVKAVLKSVEYRKQYNSREDVKAARKQYAEKRREDEKAIRQLLQAKA